MDLDDPSWARLLGGYRTPYDPRQALRLLEAGKDPAAAWDELWNELHHQGDVGEASYAAVPHLVRIHEARGVPDWNTYALVAAIEEARRNGNNPELTENLTSAYEAAWRRLVEIGIRELRAAEDAALVSSIIAVVAMAKGQGALGRFAALFDEKERAALLAKAGWT
jgi:hypothetical protein